MKSRKLLMIPGPIEFEPEVLQAIGAPTTSHVAPDFIESFGKSLEMMREVWMAPNGQPFIIAGSGTLAMDLAGANLLEPGDKALVLSTGYFGLRYADLLSRYGAVVDLLESETGLDISLDKIETALKSKQYKLLTFTHVDTSTAVRVNAKAIAGLASKYNVLSVLDGVCSVAGEEIRQEEWGIDIVLTASQKAIGVPPGLALLVASEKAMDAWKKRTIKAGNYYADWSNWLPIMQAYEARRPSYFGTPAVNLVLGLEKSLEIILQEGMENRFNRHKMMSNAFQEGIKAAGLDMIPKNDGLLSSTLSAIYYPDGANGGDILKTINESGVIVAGGLLPEINAKYFRVGHMGSVNKNDVLSTLGGIEKALKKTGFIEHYGAAISAALNIL